MDLASVLMGPCTLMVIIGSIEANVTPDPHRLADAGGAMPLKHSESNMGQGGAAFGRRQEILNHLSCPSPEANRMSGF
jgi:hypothetical protein